jgi:hypothetical protein
VKNHSESKDSFMKEIRTILIVNATKKKSNVFKSITTVKRRKSTSVELKRVNQLNSNSEDDRSRSTKREDKIRSVTDTLIEMQTMKSRDTETKMTQRAQHHEKMMLKTNETMTLTKMQHEKRMLMLRIELKKTS